MGAMTVTLMRGDCLDVMATLEENSIDTIITDPPRAGMHPKAVAMMRKMAPPAIIYVSCNPASPARDGRSLV